jgi:hypothetical protein
MPGVSCTQCGERFYWTEHYGEKICPKCNLLSRTAFHVRYIENGVEQEQIFLGVPDGNGGFNINVPTPCTLLSVREHGFPYCEVCDDPVNSYVSPRDCEAYRERSAAELPESVKQAARQTIIRAEVEAMDWPEVIGE